MADYLFHTTKYYGGLSKVDRIAELQDDDTLHFFSIEHGPRGATKYGGAAFTMVEMELIKVKAEALITSRAKERATR